MEVRLQNLIAFYLTGRRAGTDLLPMDGINRPALFARFADLSSLRYDFPLVLNRKGPPEWSMLSLTQLVDAAVEGLADSPERGRIGNHGYRLEREVRSRLASGGAADFAEIWDAAADSLAVDGDEAVKDSAARLWEIFQAAGEVVDADAAMPEKALSHMWSSVQQAKAKAFRQKTERLLLKLRDILKAEMVGSTAGRTPERLKAGVGASFAGAFNFEAFSTILADAKPSVLLSDERRARITSLIDVIERQRFYPIGDDGPEPYRFAFDRCSDALTAYNERHRDAIELAKTLAVAELESGGDYRDSVHDVLFEGFGANGLDAGELAKLPDYLVCTNGQTLDTDEMAQMIELLAAGLPFKILVRTDDVLEPSALAEGHAALGLRSRQVVDTAIGLTDVFVFQASSAQLFCKRNSIVRGLTYAGPALFSVFSGANDHTGGIPAYLVAAAATESRVFPSLVYDPSAGSDWATRLSVDDNPSPDDDWPVHQFTYEDDKLQSQTEDLAFTLADFMAMDNRFHAHFAIMPESGPSDNIVSIPKALQPATAAMPEAVPGIALVDADGRLRRAIVDDRTLVETRRCRTMWHSLQELGGIHNSHAERLLAQERKAQSAATNVPTIDPPVAAAAAQVSSPEPTATESHGDEPYVETERCTSCNECTLVNPKMFAYNDLKQAYIVDADAGTFRQLVEAAEGCQVGIIHPGKPRNPKEPGLEDLIRRAAEFI